MTHPRHLLLFTLLLGGCASQGGLPPAALPPVASAPQAVPAHASTPAPVTPPPAAAASTPEADPATAPRIMRGDDKVIAPAAPVAPLSGAATSLKFEEAPIAEVVRTMLGDMLKVSYVLHPPLDGSLTLSTRGAVSADEALFLLESALQANGLAMVLDARGVYHVGKPEALKGISPGIRQVTPSRALLQPGNGAIIVPLQYIGAGEMATILRPMAPEGAIVRVDSVRNLLILAGNRAQAEGWLDVVRTFDVNLLKGMSVGLFPLKYANTREVEAALQLVSGGAGAASTGAASSAASAPAASTAAAAIGAAPRAANAGAGAALLGESNPLFGALRVMPIERLNAILVVTPRAAYLDEARRWIEKFDQPGNGGNEPQLNIYRVQNGNAQHLSGVLSGIFGGTSGTPASPANSGIAPTLSAASASAQPFAGTGGFGGLGNAAGSSGGFGGGFGGNTGALGGTGRAAGNTVGTGFGNTQRSAQPAQGAAVATLGSIRVMADTQNNTILVWSTRAEFEKIESALRRLDLPPTQVLIEATIIEVTLSDDLKYGLQWAFTDSHRRGPGAGLIGQVPGASAGGFSYTLTDSLGNLRLTLNALADKSLIKVISSPSLMVLDNQVATMAVGTQQPIRTGETNYLNNTNINQGTPITTNYQYKDTGVQLQVQPSVNSGDLVTMDINQSVTDVGDQDPTTGQRTFLQRQIASKVAVRSGQAIVLGGLIKDNASTGKSGVPLLQDIPILGHLFGATTTNNARTELLVVITPKVVRTDPEIRQVSEELRERLQGLKLLQPPPAAEPQ